MIGSHNIPPPPLNEGDRASIAAVIGEPEIPLDVTNDAGGASLTGGENGTSKGSI